MKIIKESLQDAIDSGLRKHLLLLQRLVGQEMEKFMKLYENNHNSQYIKFTVDKGVFKKNHIK